MKNNRKKAFTLVEVLIVLTILGILFVVLVANVDFSSNAAKESGVQNTFHAYQVACESVGLQYNGFTNDKEQLVKYLNKKLDSKYALQVSGSEIVSNVEDPWGQIIKVVYSEPIDSKGQLKFISAGPDEEYDTADDIMTQIRCTMDNDILVETPKNDPNHNHDFTLQVALPEFLYQEANCQQTAKYYLSCTCGAKGDSVFDFGSKNFDKHTQTTEAYVPHDENVHKFTITCLACGNVSQENYAPHQTNGGEQCIQCGDFTHRHNYNLELQLPEYKKNDASCAAPLTYFKSCSCGQKGTETFTVGAATEHDFTKRTLDYPISEATCASPAKYYLTCTYCNAKGTTSYVYGEKNTSNHVGGETTQYVNIDDTRHTKKVICLGCGFTSSETIENHFEGCGCHTHQYFEEVVMTDYLKSGATCTGKAVYYTSCECGKSSQDTADENTFEYGNILGHNPATTATWDTNHTTATVKCTRCAKTWSGSATKNITTTGNCTTAEKYNHKATVNVNGTDKTFTCTTTHTGSKNASNHTGSIVNAATASACKWYSCCNLVTTSSHTGGAAATCTTAQKCTVCGYTMVAAKGHSGSIVLVGTENVHSKYSGCGHTYSSTHDFGAASCTTPQSCSCGFSTGSGLGHAPSSTGTWDANHTKVTVKCTRAGCTQTWTSTTVNETTTRTATCLLERQYKHTTTFNVNGTPTTFTCTTTHTGSKNASNHTGSIVNAATASACKWYSCCHLVTTSSHTGGAAATCTTAQKCTVCGYTMVAAKGHSGSAIYGGTASVHTKYSGCGCTITSTHSYGNATCTAPATCECGYSTGSILGHDTGAKASTASACKKCSRCGTITDTSHNYAYTCSSTCSDCGYNRGNQTHPAATDDGNCMTAVKCQYGCGTTVISAKASHSYTHACDTSCNNSGCTVTRTISHSYGNASCTAPATCTVCGASTGGVLGHTYDNTCDTTCNRCGATRTITHTYSYTCDTTCNVCGATRSASHSYPADDGNCTTAVVCSNGCGTVKTAAKSSHSYTNACDTSCNNSGCTKTRSITHNYTTASCTSPATCTVCGATSGTATGHSYGTVSWSGSGSSHSSASKTCSRCSNTLSATISTNQNKTTATCKTASTWSCKATFSDGTAYACSGHTGSKDSSNHENSATYYGSQAIHTYYPCCGATASSTHSLTYVGTAAKHSECACGYYTTTHSMVSQGTASTCKKCACGYADTTHDYDSSSSSANCTTKGSTTYDCKDCTYGYTSEGSYNSSNHWGSKTYVGTSSTCYRWSCCGATSSAHSYNRTSATCQYSRYCINCDYVYANKKSHSLSTSWDHNCNLTVTCSAGCGGSWTASGTHSTKTASNCTTKETYDHVASVTIDGSTRTYRCGTTHTGSTSSSHSYSAATCYKAATCSRCGATTGTATGKHSYTNNCDKSCNNTGCSYTRTIPTSNHSYTNACDTSCNNSGCSYTRTIPTSSHVYTNNCDRDCNNSGCTYTRTVTHAWTLKPTSGYESSHHSSTCTLCGATMSAKSSHSFAYSSNGSSGHTISCEQCTYVTTSSHRYGSPTNITKHAAFSGHNDTHDATYICASCGYQDKRTYEPCTWNDDPVIKNCTICGQGKG